MATIPPPSRDAERVRKLYGKSWISLPAHAREGIEFWTRVGWSDELIVQELKRLSVLSEIVTDARDHGMRVDPEDVETLLADAARFQVWGAVRELAARKSVEWKSEVDDGPGA